MDPEFCDQERDYSCGPARGLLTGRGIQGLSGTIASPNHLGGAASGLTHRAVSRVGILSPEQVALAGGGSLCACLQWGGRGLPQIGQSMLTNSSRVSIWTEPGETTREGRARATLSSGSHVSLLSISIPSSS